MATVILAIGITALAGLSVHYSHQVRGAWERTEEAIARQTVQERMHRLPYDDVESGSATLETRHAEWTVTEESPETKLISVTTTPLGTGGYPNDDDTSQKPDTFTIRRLR